ncbi:MAG: tRNA (adenosine(37)-N6)-threonylcarbamoyltransferase complex dimerization subunit type 1 TsaB [Bacillaceae bacterium]
MKILAIDTSNYPLALAVVEEERVIGEFVSNVKKNHSIRLMPAIETLLQECDIKPADLDKIVVAKGPGSYTGVRIGVTVAKTLAWSLNIPIVGVSSLAALAASGRYFDGYVCPIFDARRGQVFTGLYKYEDNQLVEVEQDQNILLTTWVEQLKAYDKPILFIGNDVSLHEQTIKEIMGGQAIIAPIVYHNPRPSELGILGMNQAAEENVHALVPNYIRMAEAEANWLMQQKNGEQK